MISADQLQAVRTARLELIDAGRPSAFLDWALTAEPDEAEADHVGTVYTTEIIAPGAPAVAGISHHVTLHKLLPGGTKLYSGLVDATYSIDSDPSGIRKRVTEAVVGALAFGAQNVNPAPKGHWLGQLWEIGRAERDMADKALTDAKRWRRFRGRDAYEGIDADRFIDVFGADADVLIDAGTLCKGSEE